MTKEQTSTKSKPDKPLSPAAGAHLHSLIENEVTGSLAFEILC